MNAQMTKWPHGRVRCAEAVHARRFDEELVILDLAKGEYFALDDVGARLWAGLQEGRTLGEIAEEIVAEYDVPLTKAIADLAALGETLVAQGLLIPEGQGGPAGGG
jgi:hypothetical protein